MPMIDIAVLDDIFDDWVTAYQRVKGASNVLGMQGAYAILDEAVTDLTASANFDAIVGFGRQLAALRDLQVGLTRFGLDSKPFFAALDRHCKNFGGANFSNVETALIYYNATAPYWLAQQHPDYRDLYHAIKGGSNYPAARNVYFEVLQGATYANGLAKAVVHLGAVAFTAGFDVDYAKYAGGVPYLKVTALDAPGTVIVEGRAFKPDGTTVDEVTWSAIVDDIGDFALTPVDAPANSRIVTVTDITTDTAPIGGGGISIITEGTIYVQAVKPAGRL